MADIAALLVNVSAFVSSLRVAGKPLSTLEQGLILLLESATTALSSLSTSSIDNQTSAIEEDRRLRSCVIERLAESTHQLPSKRVQYDREAVTALLDTLGIETSGLVHFRMGRITNGRPRLLKLMLPTRSMQQLILQRASKLRFDSRFNGVFIRPSLTQAQRTKEYQLREQKRQLNREGINVVVYDGKVLPRVQADLLNAQTSANAPMGQTLPPPPPVHPQLSHTGTQPVVSTAPVPKVDIQSTPPRSSMPLASLSNVSPPAPLPTQCLPHAPSSSSSASPPTSLPAAQPLPMGSSQGTNLAASHTAQHSTLVGGLLPNLAASPSKSNTSKAQTRSSTRGPK